jgi:hypothetical protein
VIAINKSVVANKSCSNSVAKSISVISYPEIYQLLKGSKTQANPLRLMRNHSREGTIELVGYQQALNSTITKKRRAAGTKHIQLAYHN